MKRLVIIFLTLAVLTAIPLSSGKAVGKTYPGLPLEGYIKEINLTDQWVSVEEYSGRVRRWSLSHNAVIMIDDTPAEPKDFKPGMEIYAHYIRNNITYMESWSTENLGYISPGTKVRSGTVKKIDRDQLIIRYPTGKEETYFTSPATLAVKNGVSVPLSTLYEGDSVRLYFDEKDSPIISRVKIQGDSVKIKGLYKGQLDVTKIADGVLGMKNVEVFQDGAWREFKSVLRMDLSRDLSIFFNGQAQPSGNIKYFRGRTVYLAVKDFFGRDQVEKMVIKNQYETTFSDKIEEINWYGEAFELKNKQNIGFNEGTIFIKNHRLVDAYSVNPGSDAFVVTDGRGKQMSADVVYIYDEDINNSNIGQYYLYSGQLDMVVQNRVTLTDFFLLNRNEWESFDDDKELYYDNDTYIFDLEEMNRITPEQFYTEHYAVDEDSSYARHDKLKSWHVYAYTDGDRIVAIALKKDMDSLLRQRITLGTVDKLEEDPYVGMTVSLRDAQDWSRRNDKWMPKTVPVRMRVEKALLIKDDKVISWDELKPGDNIYSVRDDFEGKFLMVK
ncbi:MAG: hypothetical protein PHE70_05710 [Tepidanaerobacteraceae bacterium]|nr:hypothetical protein [Tepidanaerobacteraceae bacterium]